MICVHCGRPTRLIKSEEYMPGAMIHYRQCTGPLASAHPESVFKTYEIIQQAISAIGPLRLAEYIRIALRGIWRRNATRDLRTKVQASGKRPASLVAREIGCTEARVRQIRREVQV